MVVFETENRDSMHNSRGSTKKGEIKEGEKKEKEYFLPIKRERSEGRGRKPIKANEILRENETK